MLGEGGIVIVRPIFVAIIALENIRKSKVVSYSGTLSDYPEGCVFLR